jgi:hypothetical protein
VALRPMVLVVTARGLVTPFANILVPCIQPSLNIPILRLPIGAIPVDAKYLVD